MIYFQVEYKDSEGTWCETGPRYSQYSDALDRLTYEFKQDSDFSHRIVQTRTVHTILAEITAKAEALSA